MLVVGVSVGVVLFEQRWPLTSPYPNAVRIATMMDIVMMDICPTSWSEGLSEPHHRPDGRAVRSSSVQASSRRMASRSMAWSMRSWRCSSMATNARVSW